tara:strand:+ start:115 stop:327 length:213 start_codon:yes stop_codon:yes gene_type:complete
VLVVLTLVLQLVEQLIVHQEEVLEVLVLYLRVLPHPEVLVVEDNIDQVVQDLVEQVMLEDIVHQKEIQVE